MVYSFQLKIDFLQPKKPKSVEWEMKKKPKPQKKTENGQCTSSTYYSNYPEKRKI